MSSRKKILELTRQIEVKGEYDVLVIGGGPAGISASISAARAGARTLLLERYGFLGGLATAGMVGSFCGFFTTGVQKKEIIGGIAKDLLNRLRSEGGLSEKRISALDPRIAVYQYSPEVLKGVAEEAAVQAGVEMLFHTLTADVVWEKEESHLSGVVVENKSGCSAFLGKMVIDATGDGDIACKARVPFDFGDGQGTSQSMTTIFRLFNVDPHKFRELDRQWLRKALEKAREEGFFRFQRVDPVVSPAIPSGLITANMTGIPNLSALDAGQLTSAEMEGRRQVFEYLKFLRKSVPGFEQAEISSIATQVGARETRRIHGEYMLAEHEILQGRKFGDAIALGAWPVELHNPATGRMELQFLEKEDDYYTIPLRCLIPRKVNNLLIAGRCISTTHIAQASTRVIGPCLAMGEAAGILAAQSIHAKKTPQEAPAQNIQKELWNFGAILEI